MAIGLAELIAEPLVRGARSLGARPSFLGARPQPPHVLGTRFRFLLRACVFHCLALAFVATGFAAEVVFLDGTVITGRTISKNRTHLKIEVVIEGDKVVRDLELSKLHKVTINGKTYLLNKKRETTTAASRGSARTRQEVVELIEQQGRTPPDWYDETPLDYPDSLDLSWPMPAPKPWNNQKNVGQYVWDVINPNTGKWPNGIRLMHHLLQLNQDDREVRTRVMKSLGSMYFRFYQDYPRAAFWWQQAGVRKGDPDSIGLAECYWRMGNKRMGRQFIDNRRVQVATIKLLGDMGDTKGAMRIAELFAQQVKEPQTALLAAADACRAVGQYRKATEYYRRVLDVPSARNEQYERRYTDRAKQGIEAIKLFQLSDPRRAKDGTYRAESMAYEGPLTVEMRISDGRIDEVRVAQHKEKQFYSAMRDVPGQIIEKQSVKNIDATSRATITADAIIHASAKALSNATRGR